MLSGLLWRPPFQRIQIQETLTKVYESCPVIRLYPRVNVIGKYAEKYNKSADLSRFLVHASLMKSVAKKPRVHFE